MGAAVLAVLALLLVACGSSGTKKAANTTVPGSSSGASLPTVPGPKVHVTIASFNFAESAILASIYERALRARGYDVSLRRNLGSREVVEPALERGEIDMYPGYAATELEFVNKGAGEASSDVTATVGKLRERLGPKGITTAVPSPAVDTNAFAVTKATADKNKLKNLSDLTPLASNMVLGGPPECPTRPFCAAGLQRVYGLRFKSFRPLDAGGPLTKAALEHGDIDVGLIFSSDGAIAARGFVVLDDDKHLQNADNVVPVLRSSVATPEVTSALNRVSEALTTADLIALNKRSDVDHEDPDVLAQQWLKDHDIVRGQGG